jgi:hypothetical protein
LLILAVEFGSNIQLHAVYAGGEIRAHWRTAGTRLGPHQVLLSLLVDLRIAIGNVIY